MQILPEIGAALETLRIIVIEMGAFLIVICGNNLRA